MLSNIKWQDNRIEIIQPKTATAVNLPLLPDVGWAIIDYLKNVPVPWVKAPAAPGTPFGMPVPLTPWLPKPAPN